MAIRTKRFISARKSCSCSMPGVWRAVAYCDGAVVIFHSPRACAHVARSMDINAHYRTMSDGSMENRSTVPLLSSQLEEKHSIFGGAEQLERCIKFALATYKPQCIVIANSCVAGVIGDDVDAVARDVEKICDVPVITVDCFGFLDGEYYQGYFETTERIIDRFFKPQLTQAGTALLLGDNGGPWGLYAQEVKRLLRSLGIQVIGQFPGYMPIDKLAIAAKAEAAVILGGRGQVHLGLQKIAEKLKNNFNIKYIPDVYPVGWQETQDWILAMGRLFNCSSKADKLLQEEQQSLQKAVAEFLPVTAHKKTVLCIGRFLMYFHPKAVLETISKLQMDLLGVVLLDVYDLNEKNKMITAIKKCTDIEISDVKEAECLIENADVILTTHELSDKKIKQIFLPMLPKVGTTGEINFMKAIYRCLCSKINRGGIRYV